MPKNKLIFGSFSIMQANILTTFFEVEKKLMKSSYKNVFQKTILNYEILKKYIRASNSFVHFNLIE